MHMKWLSVMVWGCLQGATAWAAPVEEDWAQWNQAVVEQHIVPRYQQLAESTAQLASAVAHHCAAPTQDALQQAQQRFKAALHDWQGIQHVQFGPVTTLMRNHSLQFWPDRKNIAARQLKEVLQADNRTYDAAFFHAASISIKGFPALERLLFASEQSTLLSATSVECAYSVALSQHIADDAKAIRNDWQQEAQLIATAGEQDDYESHAEAATELLKSLVEPLEAIRDNKLLKPLGDSASKMRWQKSESWRSGQSLANIQSNLDALTELYQGTTPVSVADLLVLADADALAKEISARFELAHDILSRVPPFTGTQVPTAARKPLLELADTLKGLQQALEEAMKTLDIQLGFNSRDGD